MMACACLSVNSKLAIRPSRRVASAILGRADQLDDGVQIIQRLLEAEQDVLALAGLAQQIVGAPAHHVHAVVDEALQSIEQAQSRAAAR